MGKHADYINDGVYGAFNCILFDHQHVTPYVLSLSQSFHIPPSSPSPSSPNEHAHALAKASVWGPTCDSIDLVCPSVHLPSSLRVGDWLGFDNMGAYTRCAASMFNGFEVSRVVYTMGVGGAGVGGGVNGVGGSEEVRRVLAEWAEKEAAQGGEGADANEK